MYTVIEAIKILITMIVVVVVAVLFLACASKQIEIESEQSLDTISIDNNYAYVTTAHTSKDMQHAINIASHECRVLLAEFLDTETLRNSMITKRDIKKINSLQYRAVITVRTILNQ